MENSQIKWSSSNSVIDWQMNRQLPSAQEFGARPTVHRTLEGFQSIDLPFGLAVTPELGHRVFDGVEISPQRASEAVNCVNSGLLRVIEPEVELLDVFT